MCLVRPSFSCTALPPMPGRARHRTPPALPGFPTSGAVHGAGSNGTSSRRAPSWSGSTVEPLKGLRDVSTASLATHPGQDENLLLPPRPGVGGRFLSLSDHGAEDNP